MGRSYLQPAFTSPVPGTSVFAASGVDPVDSFEFIRGKGLVGDDVVEAIGGFLECGAGSRGEGFVGDCDVAFGRPHWEG